VKAFLLLIAISSAAFANVATFNFETTPAGFYPGSLVVSNNGLTLTVTPEGDPSGFVNVANSNVPLLGQLSAIGSSTNPLSSDNFDPLRFSFSQPVSSITFAFGDAGGDDDSPVVINGYGVGNNLLGTLTTDYPAGFSAGKELSGSFVNASYFVLMSGPQPETPGSNSNSIFWEVPSVEFGPSSTTPEPSFFVLVGLGLTGFVVRRKLISRSSGATGTLSRLDTVTKN
jgi:hypothetical protein